MESGPDMKNKAGIRVQAGVPGLKRALCLLALLEHKTPLKANSLSQKTESSDELR